MRGRTSGLEWSASVRRRLECESPPPPPPPPLERGEKERGAQGKRKRTQQGGGESASGKPGHRRQSGQGSGGATVFTGWIALRPLIIVRTALPTAMRSSRKWSRSGTPTPPCMARPTSSSSASSGQRIPSSPSSLPKSQRPRSPRHMGQDTRAHRSDLFQIAELCRATGSVPYAFLMHTPYASNASSCICILCISFMF